jgi:hypothetical protein
MCPAPMQYGSSVGFVPPRPCPRTHLFAAGLLLRYLSNEAWPVDLRHV